VSLFVDTSVWSLMLRRDLPAPGPEVRALAGAIEAGDEIFTTGLVLQELLQGFLSPHARRQIIDRFSALPLLSPGRDDHVEAAGLRNRCRRAGIQVGTIDALLAQLCIAHGLTLLTADRDYRQIARLTSLRLWST
jgi:predicted nucleic acid-binding protein